MSGLTQEVPERRVHLNTAEIAVVRRLVSRVKNELGEGRTGKLWDIEPVLDRIDEKLGRALAPRRRDR